jgi:hypothetical protein
MRWTVVLGTLLGTLMITSTHFQQPAPDVRLTIAPERKQIDSADTISLVVVAENNAAQDIQNVSFAFANKSLTFTVEQPLPAGIVAHSAATGLYTVQITRQATYTLVGNLTYNLMGQQRVAIAQTEVSLQGKPGIGRDLLLVLIGALAGVLGGFLAELGKGWLSRRQQAEQQSQKALGLLIPTLTVCALAVEQNRQAPIQLWDEVYFKEGLHAAMTERAGQKGQGEILTTVAELYARLREYNTNPQFVDRPALRRDLLEAQAALRRLL